MLDIKHSQKDLNIFEIQKLIDIHRADIGHYRNLYAMYNNHNDIRGRVKYDPSAPNNKIAHSYANYIVTASVGYFMGKPIGYSMPESYHAVFDDIFKYNDEAAVNIKLAIDCSIFGQAVEMLFMDENLYGVSESIVSAHNINNVGTLSLRRLLCLHAWSCHQSATKEEPLFVVHSNIYV